MENINSLTPIDIMTSGMKAQAKAVEVISSNIANARTTDAGNGEPYRRLEAMMKSSGEDEMGGVEIDGIIRDMSDFQRILAKPGDPRADAQGYISLPNISIPDEIVSLNVASRNYQANIAVMKRYQTMVNSALELLK